MTSLAFTIVLLAAGVTAVFLKPAPCGAPSKPIPCEAPKVEEKLMANLAEHFEELVEDLEKFGKDKTMQVVLTKNDNGEERSWMIKSLPERPIKTDFQKSLGLQSLIPSDSSAFIHPKRSPWNMLDQFTNHQPILSPIMNDVLKTFGKSNIHPCELRQPKTVIIETTSWGDLNDGSSKQDIDGFNPIDNLMDLFGPRIATDFNDLLHGRFVDERSPTSGKTSLPMLTKLSEQIPYTAKVSFKAIPAGDELDFFDTSAGTRTNVATVVKGDVKLQQPPAQTSTTPTPISNRINDGEKSKVDERKETGLIREKEEKKTDVVKTNKVEEKKIEDHTNSEGGSHDHANWFLGKCQELLDDFKNWFKTDKVASSANDKAASN